MCRCAGVLCLVAGVLAAPVSLPSLNIDRRFGVVAVGFGASADFAHQFHVAFSSIVDGACVFAGQPFNCAVSHFNQDTTVPRGNNTRVPNCNGCPDNMTLPFDHCKTTPHIVDVGSLVDYPRRHCGQNPISIQECFDDVDYVKNSRVFLFRGTEDKQCAAGSVENVAGLLAQMMTDPARSIKVVADQPFAHVLPLSSTPYDGDVTAAGYDGPGECLRHVFDAPAMSTGRAVNSSWVTFNQSEFFDDAVGFQEQGWVYIPQRCRAGSGAQVCKLIIRPDTCSPPTSFAPDAADFANYAEKNALVLLHPCLGGRVDNSKFQHAPDIEDGKLDVYGQLGPDYVQQSAPHMRTIGRMVRRVLGAAELVPPAPDRRPAPAKALETPRESVTGAAATKMPTLNIDRKFVMTAGCSNTADFSHQFHVAFSSLVTGSCIFSGMPFHCAVTRFPKDYMVPKTAATAAGIHCPDCDANGTLIYDHCKNHPLWVDIDMLAQYAETAPNVDDPKVHLADARVFSFGPTHDRCYQPPAMENVANFHLRYAKDPSQIKLVEDQPFPHTLPTNSTPYFNNVSNTTGAGYDGPGHCLQHVFGHGERMYPAEKADPAWWLRVNVSEFVPDLGVGIKPSAWLFVPPACEKGLCKLLVLPGGCNAFTDTPPDENDDWARYGVANDIVILKPCQGGPIDEKRFPNNHENLRGMVDVYGQLSADYATQNGDQMRPIGKMIKRLLGVEQV